MKILLALVAALAASRTLAVPVLISRELDARSAFAPFGRGLVQSRLIPGDLSKADNLDDGTHEQQLFSRTLAPINALLGSTAKSVGRAVDGIIGNSVEAVPIVGSSRNAPSSTIAESSEAAAQRPVSKPKRKRIPVADLSEEERQHVRKLSKARSQKYKAKIKASDDAVREEFKGRRRLIDTRYKVNLKKDAKRYAAYKERRVRYDRERRLKRLEKAASQTESEPAQVPESQLESLSLLNIPPPRTSPSLEGHSQLNPASINGPMQGTATPGRLGGDAAEERHQFDLNLPPPGLDLNQSPA